MMQAKNKDELRILRRESKRDSLMMEAKEIDEMRIMKGESGRTLMTAEKSDSESLGQYSQQSVNQFKQSTKRSKASKFANQNDKNIKQNKFIVLKNNGMNKNNEI